MFTMLTDRMIESLTDVLQNPVALSIFGIISLLVFLLILATIFPFWRKVLVSPKVLEPDERPLVAAVFLHLLHAAERPQRSASRLGGRQAGGEVAFDQAVEVGAELVVHFGFVAMAVEETGEADEGGAEGFHRGSRRLELATRRGG